MKTVVVAKILHEAGGGGGGGATVAVVSLADYGSRGSWFETWPGRRSLWPLASHIYPLLSAGLTQEAVDEDWLRQTIMRLETTLCLML